MPLQLLISVGGVEEDYTRYVDEKSIRIVEQLSVPTQMTFILTPIGKRFKVPVARAYVTLYSMANEKSVFTGFITSPPKLDYLARTGLSQGGQLFSYSISCMSDEHLLNCKAVPFIPAYVNRTQGQILTDLANVLCPGFFDTSMVSSGDLIPFFEYDPSKSWSESGKFFGDGSRYRVHAKDRILWYQPYGDLSFGIDYDESKPQSSFSTKDLKTDVLTVPLVNDVTIVGATEAGNNREDYFIGDGFTSNFPLLHQVFQGTQSILVQETWNGLGLNTQQWFLKDPGVNFDFSAGALNVIDTLPAFALGESVLSMNNGLEIAGGIDIQVGEVTFNDYCDGVLGGIYTDSLFDAPGLLAGFNVTSTGTIVTSPSGAGGIEIQAYFSGSGVGPVTVTRPNHNYVLQMIVTAPQYSRYTRTYRTQEGIAYGGVTNEMQGNLTFVVQDFDTAAATGFFYSPQTTTYSLTNVDLPPFVVFALVNNRKLNLTITNTLIGRMPLGSLSALVGPSGLMQPTGLILPMLPAGSGGFTGPVLPWESAGSGNILPDPLLLGGTQQLVLGNGFNLQAAQITQGNSADSLSFYAQSIPAAGTPVRFQSWEAQAAVSRLQVSGSIAEEAEVVGDDGIRSAIIQDLNPLPRTSEDCDNAALAFLADRTGTFYTGTYTCTSLFFRGLNADLQFYPTCGRYLNVNAPRRGIVQQKFLVTGLTTTVRSLADEILQFEIKFGADLYLEKVLRNFVDTRPVQVLTSADKAHPPVPRFTTNVETSFLPDLNNTHIDLGTVTGLTATVNVLDTYLGPIEIRRIDANWGKGITPDYIDTVLPPAFVLQRQQYDQVWYLRSVANGLTSRRSKVLRLRWPVQPATPLFVGQNSASVLQFNFNGDMRNIYGFELRLQTIDGQLILVQKPITSYPDLTIDLSQTPFNLLSLANPSATWTFFAYFFNQGWGYSEPLTLADTNAKITPFIAGGMSITIDGILGIGPDQGPIAFFPSDVALTSLNFTVKQAPDGADITIDFYVGGIFLGTFTIADGTFSIDATPDEVAAIGVIPANTFVRIDITAVGVPTFPGSDLTVTLGTQVAV